jgi:signal transduction histidine kinase
MHPRSFSPSLISIRTRLFLSFALLVLVALVMAASVFVALRRGASDRETLDRVAATAPAVSFELRSLFDRGASQTEIGDYLRQAAKDHAVRILLVDQRDGSVVQDSAGSLQGKRLDLPEFGPPSSASASHWASWRGTTPETSHLTFFAAIYDPLGRPFTLGRSLADPGANVFTVVAVPRETVANAWLGLLPGLLWAGLAALALSAVMAILLSRSIARPILALTRASEEMARGNFDQEVPPARADEIGRLSTAFNTMAREVGRSYLQTRALIANVSHDLKTPLTSILGFSQALRDGAAETPEEVSDLSGIIHEEAERILAIVEDLLYLSQLESGEVALQRTPVKLDEVSARCLRRLEPLARERGVAVKSERDAGLWVMGDAGQLERILDNLLNNAGKYTPPEGEISLSTKRSKDDSSQVVVSVRNTGSYIAPADLERIFDRFYRADPSRGSATGGTGLGLAIVKDLVQLQNGTISASSSREQGTVFEVRLPLALMPAGPAETIESTPQPTRVAASPAQLPPATT